MNTPRYYLAKPVVLAASAAIFVAILGASMTDIGDWYQQLAKPSWQPPDWLFGPAWTVVFAFTAISAVKGWRSAAASNQPWLIVFFCLNALLNLLWTLLFFRLQRPDWALVEVIFLWLSVLWLIVVLARYNKSAAWLLVPYLSWVAFAGYLNLAVVRLNTPF